jgi:hypothetical protein
MWTMVGGGRVILLGLFSATRLPGNRYPVGIISISHLLTDIPRIPSPLDLIFRPWRFRRNEIRLRPPLFTAKPSDRPPGDAGTRRFSVIKAHLWRVNNTARL